MYTTVKAYAALPPQHGPAPWAPRSAMDGQSGRPASILVINGDPATRPPVVDYLNEHCLRAVCASGFNEIARHFARREPNLIILDLARHHGDGLDLLRGIRSRSNVPVIIAGGHGCDEIDRAAALDLGADDYLTKPFGLRELLARIRAVLRRDQARHRAPRVAEHGGYRFGGWQVNRRVRRLRDPRGTTVALTKGEYALLIAFLEAPQRVLTREYLAQATHVQGNVFDRSINVQVMRLRRKLGANPNSPRVIETARGVGYVFTLPVEMSACTTNRI
jgi:two-component system OmpR family response regulator